MVCRVMCVRARFSSGLKSVPLQDSAVTSVPCPQALRVRRRWCWKGLMFPLGRRSRLAALRTCGEAEGHARCLDRWAVFSSRLFPYVKIAVSPPAHMGPGGSGTHKTESGTAESRRSICLQVAEPFYTPTDMPRAPDPRHGFTCSVLVGVKWDLTVPPVPFLVAKGCAQASCVCACQGSLG